MKILQLVTKRQFRGAEVFAANLSTELLKLGHEIYFAGLYKNSENVLDVEGAENIDISGDKKNDLSIGLIFKLVKLIKQINPDVIQCNGSDTLKYMVAASYILPKHAPILYRNISMISEWVSEGPKLKVYKLLFNRVSHVSSVGKEAVNDFIKTFKYPEENTSVIRRGIPIKDLDKEKAKEELKKEVGLKETDKIVIHVGNFSEEKNHKFLIEIFRDLKNTHPDIKLVCVGQGDLYKEIKQSIEIYGLQNTVFLLGFRKDVNELLAGSDLLVLSSKVEGVPGVILEAGTQEKPAVATNVGGVNEVLVHNKTGFIIDNFDKDLFRDHIVKLAENESLRTRLGKNAYQQVVQQFNPTYNAKRFEKLYMELIKKQ